MKIGNYTFSKLQIAGLIVLLIGLIAGIYLVQQTQIFKPRADVGNINLLNAFKITNDQGVDLQCTPASGSEPVTCTTDTLNVNISVKDLNELTK